MNDEEEKKVKEQVRLRPWKMSAEQLKRNKFNPGNSLDVARDDLILNGGWVEGADNEYNLRTIEENFGTLLNSGTMSGNLDKNISAEGARERMLNMVRMLNDFPILRDAIKGMDNDAPSDAVMSVVFSLNEKTRGMLHWNPEQVVGKKGYTAPTPGADAEAEERRKRNNHNWLADQISVESRFTTADSSYSANHELGHMLNLLTAKKNHSFMYIDDLQRGETNNKIIMDSLKHLAKREKQKNLPDDQRQFTKFLESKRNERSLRTGEWGPDFGAGQDKLIPQAFDRAASRGATLRVAQNDPEANACLQELRQNANANQTPGPTSMTVPRYALQTSENRRELYNMNQTSLYGADSPDEMIAEAFADVYSRGKEASKLNKQIVKRMWRALNPDAAYEEDRQKSAARASGKKRKPGSNRS